MGACPRREGMHPQRGRHPLCFCTRREIADQQRRKIALEIKAINPKVHHTATECRGRRVNICGDSPSAHHSRRGFPSLAPVAPRFSLARGAVGFSLARAPSRVVWACVLSLRGAATVCPATAAATVCPRHNGRGYGLPATHARRVLSTRQCSPAARGIRCDRARCAPPRLRRGLCGGCRVGLRSLRAPRSP